MRRLALAIAAIAVWVACVKVGGDDPNPYAHAATIRARGVLVQGRDVRWWAQRAVRARRDANARARTIRRLRRVIAGDTTIVDAIRLAAVTFHVDPATLERKASCESTGGNGYNPAAYNSTSGAAGLFQFEPGTWSSTPYRAFSPYDPLAAALAAGWMHSPKVHRGAEWDCR